jgi:uncharacterized membrane protein YjgN (DUF898 family)
MRADSPVTDADPSPVSSYLEFTGNGREYFGIWIVNILLTILTLGIYSAWAKVRRNRYFYGNTRLLGSGFDYHARPGQILTGRIIALVLIIAFNIISQLFPLVGLVLILLLLAALPAIVVSGLRFNARMSSYRNVRFGFDGTYWGAAKAFVAGPLLASLSFGILAPFASKWSARYLLSNLRYGNLPARSSPALGAIYRVWLVPAGVAVLGLGLLALIVFGNISSITSILDEGQFTDPDSPPVAFIALIYLITFGLIFVYALAGLFYYAGVRNIALNATVIDNKHNLVSDMPRGKYVWVAVTNFLAAVFSLGLLRPWAAVRMAKFQSQHTGVAIKGDVGEVFSNVKSDESAFGGEFMDLEGIGVGI